MPRKAEGPKPLTAAQRQARRRQKVAEQMERWRLLLEEIEAATRRHPLMEGFAHHQPSAKELQERLDVIAALAREALELA